MSNNISDEQLLDTVLDNMVKSDASDLYITVGSPIKYRCDDKLITYNPDILTKKTIDAIINQILTPEQIKEFDKSLEYNVSLERSQKSRFRVNLFYQQGNCGMVIRRIRTIIPTVEELG